MTSTRFTFTVLRIAPAAQSNATRAPATRSITDRIELGRRVRKVVPRSSIGEFERADDRVSPIEILEAQARSRLAELVPVRYGRMARSPFANYRGAAAVMAADLATGPSTGLTVQLCGDAHLLNFGLYAAPDRHLVFSINDFDETLPGPFDWDVKRLGASLVVAARELSFDQRDQLDVATRAVRTYRRAMRQFAAMRAMDVWYTRLDLDQIVRQFGARAEAEELGLLRRAVRRAERRDSLTATALLTQDVDGQLQFVNDPPLLVRAHDLLDATSADRLVTTAGRLLSSYRSTLSPERRVLVERFRCVDLARKVVGVGSVGTRTWVALLLGRDEQDPLILQFKQAEASVLEQYLGTGRYDNHGRRVVEGQHLMQASSDVLLGWQRTSGLDGTERDYYVRQLWDKKGSVDITLMSPRSLRLYGSMCAWTLARAHARSGDAVAIASYLGRSERFEQAMATFSERYADQNERDHGELLRAIEFGTLPAIQGV